MHTEFSIGLAEFVHFTVTLFAHKNGGAKASGKTLNDVEFVNTYKNFKNKTNGGTVDNQLLHDLKEDCRFKISYFAEK